MALPYLSPAFSPRSQEDLEFLRGINWETGFSLFWIDIVRPVLEVKGAKCLLEIGASQGDHTRLLLRYCDTSAGQIHVVEPFVTPRLREVLSRSTRARLYEGTSHNVLRTIDAPIDAVLLEGDLNYTTAYHDLLGIQDMAHRNNAPFPLVFFTAASWPYARRDMYYDPEAVPKSYRHEYARSGMTPWEPGLHEHLINFPFANAVREGGPKNGVLTAVEDFLKDTAAPLRLYSLPVNHGLGVLYAPGSSEGRYIEENLQAPPGLRALLETWELARLNQRVMGLMPPRATEGRGARGSFARALRRSGRAMIRVIER